MNEFVALITLAGTVVAVAFFLCQVVINTVRGAKLERNLEMSKMGSFDDTIKLKAGKGHFQKNNIGFLLQVFLGLMLLLSFTYWAIYLFLTEQKFTPWVILSGVVAVVSLLMLYFASRANKKRNAIIDHLLSALQTDKKVGRPQSTTLIDETQPLPVTAANISPEPEPELKPEVEAGASTVSVRQMLHGRKYSFGNIPEDSLLSRHFCSNLRAEIESGKGPRPTDSALLRHFQQMIDVETEKTMVELGAKTITKTQRPITASKTQQDVRRGRTDNSLRAAPSKSAKEQSSTIVNNIPEDSMLKRHYLNRLRSLIAANKLPCPTDSSLHRHYDQMIEAELENRLDSGDLGFKH